MKKVVILQSNYIPWKGYFDMIAYVDEFILYDDVQYTKNDWRNRNHIKTQNGLKWLTIPVLYKFQREQTQKIRDTETVDTAWAAEHWNKISNNYSKASCFQEIAIWLKPLYLEDMPINLSQINRRFIEAICGYLGINTKLSNSWDYSLTDGKTERLLDLCLQANATEYVSGPAAKAYIDEKVFFDNGIKLTWFEYSGYPAYPQLWGDFCHNVTILDLLFNCGKESSHYMKHVINNDELSGGGL